MSTLSSNWKKSFAHLQQWMKPRVLLGSSGNVTSSANFIFILSRTLPSTSNFASHRTTQALYQYLTQTSTLTRHSGSYRLRMWLMQVYATSLPIVLPPGGLSRTRWQYLFQHICQFFHAESWPHLPSTSCPWCQYSWKNHGLIGTHNFSWLHRIVLADTTKTQL